MDDIEDRDSIATTNPKRRGLSLRDLVGLVAGFAVAGFFLRHLRPHPGADIQTQVGFWGSYLWCGVAMSGPFVLWISRLGEPGQLPPREPARPGRPIADVPVGAKPEPEPPGDLLGPGARYTLNESLWMLIGGFWATLTWFLPTPIGFQFSWSGLVAIPGLVWIFLGPQIVVSMRKEPPVRSWTQPVAAAVVLTWPVASILLLLSTGLYGG